MPVEGRFVDAEDAVLEAAIAAAGHDDFGEPSYLEGLRRLLASFDSDLQRGPADKQACFNGIVTPLVGRLCAQAGWKRDPACLAAPIRRPLFVVGAPRSGTTALHKLLAAASTWQGLDNWLIKRPMTQQPRSEWERHPAYVAAIEAHESRLRQTPELRWIHDIEPYEPDECILVIAQTMISYMFGSNAHLPTYDAWALGQDMRPRFRWLADVMRLVGAAEPDTRWLSKNPSHLLNLAELMEVFPDALIVHTHRDPVQAAPSFWQLLYVMRRSRDGEALRPEWIPAREMPIWRGGLMASIDLARRHPDRILDVYEADFSADPLATVARIFAFAGETLTERSEQAARRWLAANPRDKHGTHRYAAEDFGQDAAMIADFFADYRAHHHFDERAPAAAPGG